MSRPRKPVPESMRKVHGPWVNDFLKALEPAGAFAGALREAGFDPDHPADTYPLSAFVRLVELARVHLFPSVPPPEGFRELGRRFVAGHIERGFGSKLWSKALPLLGPDRMLGGIDQVGGTGTNFITAEGRREGDNHWRVVYHGIPGNLEEFLAGCLEYALDLVKAPSGRKVVVSNFSGEDLDLDVTW